MQQAIQVLEAEWKNGLSEQQVAAANSVVDFSAEEMTCPACLTTFSTGPEECPDCGLFLGI